MASGGSVVRAARVVSRGPAVTRATESSRSMVAVGGDAFGQLVNTDPRAQAQAQHNAGVIVPMEGQGDFASIDTGDDDLDDVEE